jgi:murein DD-endopeptidase MepM/ murein hydrolase activator NlpD
VEPGAFSDTWGAARSGGRSHQGIDIFARRNTPVVSATEGVVVRAGENALGGRTITVMGPGGWRHYYAHLEKWVGREEGDWVLPGDVIGFVGTTGNAPRDAPHLHYGIYTREGAINPFPFLVARPDTLSSDTISSGAGDWRFSIRR